MRALLGPPVTVCSSLLQGQSRGGDRASLWGKSPNAEQTLTSSLGTVTFLR